MNKVISIFLLITLLIFGAHPVLAMHFCGENLHSVGMNSKVDDCCANDNAPEKRDSHQVRLVGQDCCHSEHIAYLTDNYNLSPDAVSLVSHIMPLSVITYPQNLLFTSFSLNKGRLDLPQYPPNGCLFQNTDILTYIRIFQI